MNKSLIFLIITLFLGSKVNANDKTNNLLGPSDNFKVEKKLLKKIKNKKQWILGPYQIGIETPLFSKIIFQSSLRIRQFHNKKYIVEHFTIGLRAGVFYLAGISTTKIIKYKLVYPYDNEATPPKLGYLINHIFKKGELPKNLDEFKITKYTGEDFILGVRGPKYFLNF